MGWVDASQVNHVRQWSGRQLSDLGWWLTPQGTPSFLQQYMRQRRMYSAALELTGASWGALWSWETKTGVKQVAERIGARAPATLQEVIDPADIDWDSLPSNFVVKPNRGASKAGVFVLKRQGKAFYDVLRGSIVTRSEVCSQLLLMGQKGKISTDHFLIEEALLQGKLPTCEWKMYSFQGEVGIILQIQRTEAGRRTHFWSPMWARIPGARLQTPSDRGLPWPLNPSGLLAVATDASKAVPVPFVRVDLYEHQGEVFLGELTPMPGSRQRFRRSIDLELGRMWETAEAKLLVWPDGMYGQ